jgi:hypothetical protein
MFLSRASSLVLSQITLRTNLETTTGSLNYNASLKDLLCLHEPTNSGAYHTCFHGWNVLLLDTAGLTRRLVNIESV